jgi:hypothetical protein
MIIPNERVVYFMRVSLAKTLEYLTICYGIEDFKLYIASADNSEVIVRTIPYDDLTLTPYQILRKTFSVSWLHETIVDHIEMVEEPCVGLVMEIFVIK